MCEPAVSQLSRLVPNASLVMNLHRIDLVSLSLFNLVVRAGSISRGAELATIALGAASKRLADLEAAFGVSLLERHWRGVKLTPSGEALHRHVQRILGDVDRMTADLSDYANGLMGVARLWANNSAITQFLPDELASFATVQPGIRIELNEADSQETVLAVLDGRADLGIFADRTPAMGLETQPYQRDRLVLVVPRCHVLARRKRVAFAEALEYDFVSLQQVTSIAQRLAMESAQIGRPLRIRIQVRSFDAICQMVAAGLGVAVLPLPTALPLSQGLGLQVIELTDEWRERQLMLGARSFEALTRPVRILLDHLISHRSLVEQAGDVSRITKA